MADIKANYLHLFLQSAPVIYHQGSSLCVGHNKRIIPQTTISQSRAHTNTNTHTQTSIWNDKVLWPGPAWVFHCRFRCCRHSLHDRVFRKEVHSSRPLSHVLSGLILVYTDNIYESNILVYVCEFTQNWATPLAENNVLQVQPPPPPKK